jgi:hypothetical protein
MIIRGGRIVGRFQRSKIYVLPFRKDALMVFEGRESCLLPPLYSFTIYFTHPDVNSDNVKPCELFEAIRQGCPLEDFCPFRLELFFLHVPNVEDSEEACIAHYREEKRNRGDYTRQIEALESSSTINSDNSENSAGGLPGLVPSYIKTPAIDYYHSLIYSYQGPDWTTGEQCVRRICFDPIPQDVYSSFEHLDDEPEILPAVDVFLLTICNPQIHDAPPISEDMYYKSFGPTHNVTDKPWQEARKRGWSTW